LQGWASEGTVFKFSFDGEEVLPTSTAESLGFESGDKIEVYYRDA